MKKVKGKNFLKHLIFIYSSNYLSESLEYHNEVKSYLNLLESELITVYTDNDKIRNLSNLLSNSIYIENFEENKNINYFLNEKNSLDSIKNSFKNEETFDNNNNFSPQKVTLIQNPSNISKTQLIFIIIIISIKLCFKDQKIII